MAYEFTIKPEYEYSYNEVYKTKKTPFDAGITQTRAMWSWPKRLFTLNWSTAIESEKEALLSFFREHVGSASQFLYQPVDPISSPWRNGDPTSISQVTGNYPARTYYYAFSWVTAYGETLISPVTSYALSSHTLFKLTIPKFWYRSITAARVYAGLTSSVTAQADITTSNGSWTELDIATPAINGLVAGSAFPTTNTATEKIYVILSEDEIKIIKRNPAIYSMQVSFEEVF